MSGDRKRILWEECGCLEGAREEGETEVWGAARLAGPDMDTLKCGMTSGGESRAGAPREQTHGQPLC